MKALIRREYEETHNRGNLEAAAEFIAPDYVGHHAGSADVHGPDGYRRVLAAARAAFPDLHFTVDDQLAEGDKVATRFTYRGTHRGTFRGIPPTGKSFAATGIRISRIERGKVAEDWVARDMLGALQQLGIVPPPEARP
jgi:steroid delta-isomerase-like uncharacterized protein